MTPSERAEAFEIWGPRGGGPAVFTCEHASRRLPEPWVWPDEDLWISSSHWAWDPGAAELAVRMAAATGSQAVLARFTRLLIDANRHIHAPSLFRDEADGGVVWLNFMLDERERQRRIRGYYEPYHDAVTRTVAESSGDVVAVHTFTPTFQNQPQRRMEVGVIFDREEALARTVAESIADDGWVVALNEPYSGANGMMHSADRHAREHGRRALEFEVRQDVSRDPVRRAACAEVLVRALRRAGVVP